jgi:hypothetical protein
MLVSQISMLSQTLATFSFQAAISLALPKLLAFKVLARLACLL